MIAPRHDGGFLHDDGCVAERRPHAMNVVDFKLEDCRAVCTGRRRAGVEALYQVLCADRERRARKAELGETVRQMNGGHTGQARVESGEALDVERDESD